MLYHVAFAFTSDEAKTESRNFETLYCCRNRFYGIGKEEGLIQHLKDHQCLKNFSTICGE
jgi:hypothetical protein